MRLDVARQGSSGTGQRPTQRRRKGDHDGTPWENQRSSAFSAVRLAGMRLTRGWELLLAVAVGILVAVVLICTVPLYNALVANVQLQKALASGGVQAHTVDTTVQSGRVSDTLRTDSTTSVTSLTQTYLGKYVNATPNYFVKSDNMLLLSVGDYQFNPADPSAPQLQYMAWNYATAAAHMHFIEGGAPQDAGADGVSQAIVTKQMATSLKLDVGSTLSTTEFGNHDRHFDVRVAGIWEPKDINDPYWDGISFDAGGSDIPPVPPVFPILLSQSTFFSQLSLFDSVGMTQHWAYTLRPETINTANMAAVGDSVGLVRSHLNGDVLTRPGITGVGEADQIENSIKQVQNQLSLLTLPLYVIVAQVVGLALLFVTAMAGLLIEGQSQEIATLKSRGASWSQLLGTFTLQALLLAILAALAGPFLAALLSIALIHWFVPGSNLANTGVGASYLSQLASPQAALVPAAIGALLGVAVVAFSALQSARLDVLAFRREQGRSTRQPLWRRYYLDLALVVLCIVGYVELDQFGGVSTRQELAGGNSPLLLVTPALLLLAGALLVLRLFPLGAGFGARLAARGKGLTSLLALSQVERNPGKYSRMTLLLVLSVGLGLFALTFDTSLQRNMSDRSTYTVGSDVRIQQTDSLDATQAVAFEKQLAGMPGVQGVSPVFRTTASVPGDTGPQAVDVLGIDSATFKQVGAAVSWRSDYADHSIEQLLSGMRANIHGQSAGTTAAPIWTLVSQQFAAQYHLKIGDRFTMSLAETPFVTPAFIVGDTVNSFPTLYPGRLPGSFVVTDMSEYLAAVNAGLNAGSTNIIGPNEFWLRTTADAAQHKALIQDIQHDDINIKNLTSLADVLAAAQSNPVGSGMRGLLLVGAVTAALLAILGSIVQSLLAARQRVTQFAVLRTVGMAGRQLTGLLLGEQVTVYVFGLVGGTILGLLLVTATLPFLQFSDAAVDPTQLGIPSYVITFNGQTIGIFYAALLVAFLVALAIAGRYASTIGLGKALRLGED